MESVRTSLSEGVSLSHQWGGVESSLSNIYGVVWSPASPILGVDGIQHSLPSVVWSGSITLSHPWSGVESLLFPILGVEWSHHFFPFIK